MPRAVIAGMVGTAALFLLVNVACFSVLSLVEVQESPHAVSDMLERVTGRGVAGVLTVVMVISAFGSLTASFLASGRVSYAMGRDGFLPSVVGWVNPRSGVPSGAVAWKAALAAALVLTGTFEDLSALFVFTQWLFFALGIVALFRLRRLEPDLPRPVRAWGYPVAPGIFVVLSVLLTASILMDRPIRSLLGLALILAGLPVYFYAAHRKRSGGIFEQSRPGRTS
jgi:APA family basic amino acid/polyamine antiporter